MSIDDAWVHLYCITYNCMKFAMSEYLHWESTVAMITRMSRNDIALRLMAVHTNSSQVEVVLLAYVHRS